MSIKKVYLKFASKNEAMQVLQSAGFILDIESEQYYFPGRDISVSVDGHKMVDTDEVPILGFNGPKFT